MRKHHLVATLAMTALTGCSMAPRYSRPDMPAAPALPAVTDSGTSDQPIGAEIGWREFFGDAILQELIRTALENNRDLRIADLNVEQIRAYYNIQRTALIPTLDVLASGNRAHTPGDLNATGAPITSSSYRVGLSMSSYELDFFGRVASLRNQVLEQYLASEEGRRSAQITLVAAVAAQYLSLVAIEEQHALAEQTLATVKQGYDLRQQAFSAGVTSELDVRTAEAQWQATRATLASILQQRASTRNALSVLVGGALPADFSVPARIESAALRTNIPTGLPSELLERRPDLLRAEHILKSANANIGIARAAFFPSVKLTAFDGTASAELSGLFGDASSAWSFVPEIKVPIFAAGRNKATLDVAKIQKRIEIANYERAIQNAFREVADTLEERPALTEQVEAQTARVAAAQKRYDLTEQRMRSGVDSYLPLLLAQQDLFAAQQNLISVRLARDVNLVNLYKALGGGWQENTSAATN